MQKIDEFFTISRAALMVGHTPSTLRRWDRLGIFKPEARSPTDIRLYTKAQILLFMAECRRRAVE